MDLLKELYAFESYFLTKKGLELGDKRWLERHLINFTSPSPIIFKNLVILFKRVLRLVLKSHPGAKVSVRNNKTQLIVGIKHPTLDLLSMGTVPPESPEFNFIVPPRLPHLHVRNGRGRVFYFPSLGTSVCNTHISSSLKVGMYIVQLSSGLYIHSGYGYCSAANARSAAKIFAGSISFTGIIHEAEEYISYLDELHTAIYDLLGADIREIVSLNNNQSSVLMIEQPRTDFNLGAFFEDCCITKQKEAFTWLYN